MSGSCTSTVPMEKTIVNEKEWAKNFFLDLESDNLEPKYVTTDPESNTYRAALKLYTNNLTKTVPQYQIDTRHLDEYKKKACSIENAASADQKLPQNYAK